MKGVERDVGFRPAFSWTHVISFEETNLVGNVYFARHIAWQGRCREMFLKEHAPEILRDLERDLRLVTLRVSCEYYEELRAFDEVRINMTLAYHRQHRIGLEFEYLVLRDKGTNVCGRGHQEIGCMRLKDADLVPCAVPELLARALSGFEISHDV